MKTIIKIFTVVLAAVPVLVSCYSEPLPEVIPEVIPEDGGNGSEQDDKVHVISVSFDTKATRTVLGNDGITPHFVANDEIRVSDGTHEDTFIVYEKNDNYFIDVSPEFTGELTAVYPAKYSRVVDGKLTYFVPSDQTGEFKDANICMATFDVESKSATFYNKTAIFVIDVPEGTQYLEVTSLRAINPITGQRYLMNDEVSDEKYYYSAICDCMWDYDNSEDTIVDYSVYEADDDGSVEKGRFITIGDCCSPIPRTCYVSMLVNDNVLLCDLNFDAQNVFNEDDYGIEGIMGGFSPKFLESRGLLTASVQAGAIYTGVADHLHEYTYNNHDYYNDYVYGTGFRDWATEDLVGPGGEYFMWGDVNGHHYDGGGWNFAEGDTVGFGSNNLTIFSPHFNNYSTNGSILRLEDDAAYKNWGGAWRMPTFAEWQAVTGDTQGICACLSDYAYINGTTAPSLIETDANFRYYWSSTLGNKVSQQGKVYIFYIKADTGTTEFQNYASNLSYCYYGMRIRPISDIIEYR